MGLTQRAVRLVPLSQAARVFGPEDATAVAIQLAFAGDLAGQILLLLDEGSAQSLVGWCVPGPQGPEMQASVLAEVGNVSGSAFVNEIADLFGLQIAVSPPEVVADLAGAILGSVLPAAEAVPGQALMVQTEFAGAGTDVRGLFLLMPDAPSLERLLALMKGGGVRGR